MKIESINVYDGTALRVARFEPPEKPAGVVHIVHGFGEGLDHYKGIAEYFAGNGYACIVHDQRGFGEMPGLSPKEKQKARGVVPGYYYLIEDVKEIYEKINKWYPGIPIILYGHSMGGNIVSNYLIRYQGYDRAILEAPWLRLYKPLPKLATSLAGFVGKVNNKLTINAKVNIDHITRNLEIVKDLRTDGIYHNRMSLRLYAEIVRAGEFAIKYANTIPIPMLILCPGADKIVCPDAIHEFYAAANKNAELLEFQDGYHYLHADIINADVMKAVLEFMKKS